MFGRLFNISKAYVNHRFRRKSNDPVNNDNIGYDTDSDCDKSGSQSYSSTSSETGTESAANAYGLPQQVLDDLATFGITAPGSWNEVIQARNREMKRYHPDKYMNAGDKVDAANEIAQLYNAAFERLKKHFRQ